MAALDGPQVGLALVDGLDLDDRHRYHAVRADLRLRLDRPRDAADALDRAIALCDNDSAVRLLRRRQAAYGCEAVPVGLRCTRMLPG